MRALRGMVVLGALLAGGCGSVHGGATTTTLGANACGPAYTFYVPGSGPIIGSCAGLIASRPPMVTIGLGQRVVVDISGEANGKLDYPVPTSTGTRLRLVAVHGFAAEFQARGTGNSELIAHHTRMCFGTLGRISTCPVLDVRVTL